jgi:hypothetical protein
MLGIGLNYRKHAEEAGVGLTLPFSLFVVADFVSLRYRTSLWFSRNIKVLDISIDSTKSQC